jgi:hypothetical protein
VCTCCSEIAPAVEHATAVVYIMLVMRDGYMNSFYREGKDRKVEGGGGGGRGLKQRKSLGVQRMRRGPVPGSRSSRPGQVQATYKFQETVGIKRCNSY